MSVDLKFGVMFEQRLNSAYEQDDDFDDGEFPQDLETLAEMGAIVRHKPSLVQLVRRQTTKLSPMQKFFSTEEAAIHYAETQLRKKNNPAFSYYIIQILGKVSAPKIPLEYEKF